MSNKIKDVRAITVKLEGKLLEGYEQIFQESMFKTSSEFIRNVLREEIERRTGKQ